VCSEFLQETGGGIVGSRNLKCEAGGGLLDFGTLLWLIGWITLCSKLHEV